MIAKAELLTYLTQLPPNKAAAISGWTFELIKTFINASDVNGEPARNRALVGEEISQEVDEFMGNAARPCQPWEI